MSKRKSKLKAMKKHLVTQEELEHLVQESEPILLDKPAYSVPVGATVDGIELGPDEDDNILLW